MKNKLSKPPIILIVGMHRSGTSLVAQMVAQWGAYMGSDLLPANEFNQDGYWEYNPLVNLHDKIFAYTGNTWYAPPRHNDVANLIELFGNEARALVAEMDKANTTWCWKDPRMALLLPFWQEVLKNRIVVYIIPYRNPLSIAVSLKTRDNIPTITATALWETYNRNILGAVQPTDSIFFAEYEKLIDEPDALNMQLFNFLNTALSEQKNSEVLQLMRKAIKPGLKHAAPLSNFSIDTQQKELYEIIKKETIAEQKTEEWQTRLDYAFEITDLYQKGNYYEELNLQLQLFYKPIGGAYSESNSILKKYIPNAKNVVFEFDSLSNIESLRFDPLNDWLNCSCGNLELYNSDEKIASLSASSHNAANDFNGNLFFATHDPQLHFKLNDYKDIQFNKVIINLQYLKVGTACKSYFAENPALFFNDLLLDNEVNISNDNSFSAIRKHLLANINSLQSRISETENIIVEKEKESEKFSEQVIEIEKNKNLNMQLSNDLLTLNKVVESLQTNLLDIKTELHLAQSENTALHNDANEKENKVQLLLADIADKSITIKSHKGQYMKLKQELQNKEKQMHDERIRLEQQINKTNETLYRLMANERSKLVRKHKLLLPLRLVGNLLRFLKHPLQYYRMRRDILIVRRSGLFDDAYYLSQHSDLYLTTVDMLQHFMLYGWKEGRSPSSLFNTKFYLNANPDVKDAGCNPLLHFVLYGLKEGRKPNDLFGPKYYLENNPDVRAAGVNPLLHFLQHGQREDLQKNIINLYNSPKVDDVQKSAHYILDSLPPDFFNSEYYLETYTDVKKTGVNPIFHYLNFGIVENRNPNKNFNVLYASAKYLGANKNNISIIDYYVTKRDIEIYNKTFEELLIFDNMAQIISDEQCLVSIIMASWNREDVISRAINSIINQSYKKWELIIIDDGSTDGTAEYLNNQFGELIRSSKIKVISSKHVGVSSARNIGLRIANGEWMAYLDTDNEWDENYLVYNLYFASLHKNVQILYSDLNFFKDGILLERKARNFNWDNLLQANYIDLNTYFHKKEIYDELGGFDESLGRLVDWDMILRHTKNNKPIFIPATLTNYYIGETLNNITNKVPFEKNRNIILNKMLIEWEKLQEKKLKKDFFSIVIPVYNCCELTDKCIQSIITNTIGIEYEIIIVNNGSIDDTSSMINKYIEKYPFVKYIENRDNYGFSLGNNIGANVAEGEYVLFLNNDTELTSNLLLELVSTLKNDLFVGMVAPKLLYPDNTIQFSGFAFSEMSKIPYHIYQGYSSKEHFVNIKREYQALTGACFLMRLSDFYTVKGFDPVFVNGGEDLDLSFKIRKKLGKRLLVNPLSEVYHLEGKTEGRSKMIMENRMLFVDKWFNEIYADDFDFFNSDGFYVKSYEKRGTEQHGIYAAYYPTIKMKEETFIKTKINVGFICMWYQRGITYHTLQLIKALDEEKYTSFLLSRWESDKFSNTGDVHLRNCINAGNNPTPDEVVRWINENNIQVLIQMEVHPNDWKRLEVIKAKTNCKLVLYENFDIMYKENIERYKIADYFLVNTFYGYNFWTNTFPTIPAFIVPWGIDSSSNFVEQNDSEEITFLHIAGWGGLNNRKNTGLAIKSFHKANTNAKFIIYMQCSTDVLGEEVLNIIQDDERIEIHQGTLENIFDAYSKTDVLLWPSKREGLGLPIVEALAHGLPVIISDGYMMKEWIIEGKHGLIVNSKDVFDERVLPEQDVSETDLTQKIEMIANDKNLYKKLKENVIKDSALWKWDWQKKIFSDAIQSFLKNDQLSNIKHIPKWRKVLDNSESIPNK